jgi:hypothetical protein
VARRRRDRGDETLNMAVSFEMHGKLATLEVDVDGYKVTVTVHPKPGTTITTQDADVILTNAMAHFPQRVRR